MALETKTFSTNDFVEHEIRFCPVPFFVNRDLDVLVVRGGPLEGLYTNYGGGWRKVGEGIPDHYLRD